MRKLAIAIAGIALIAMSVAAFSDRVTLLLTQGNSMNPRIATGDLVVVFEQPTYQPGDVVAYQSRELRRVVLHRIRAIHGDRYTFRGDHNAYDDVEQPEAGLLIGREVIHVPDGGVWLGRLQAPHIRALVAYALVAYVLGAYVLVIGGGTAAHKARKRRKTHGPARAL